jgi:energy-coupling factor transporter ATP-binding protein EcfA2
MSSLPTKPATDLRTAYRVCDVQPLEGDDLDRYYVQLGEARKSESMINVSVALDLQEAGEHSTILFTGHRGCGKSTELRLLQRNWQKQYHVIYLETDEVTDINDVEYTDLYLLVAQYVEYELRSLGIQLDQGIIKDFANWFADITQETEQSLESSISVQGEVTLGGESPFGIPLLAKLLAKLTSQIKGGSKDKTTIRRTLEKDFSRLKSSVNLLLEDASKKLRKQRPDCKEILLIFDNLDRCPPHVANRLFFDYAAQLQELRCTLVYTVPISVLYSPRGISNSFNKPAIVPMVNIYEFDREMSPLGFNQPGVQALRGLLERRMDTQKVFASEAEVLALIQASGGHVRHLMQMMREACATAIGRGHKAIEADDVVYAINQLQADFERLIPDAHYPAIAQSYRSKRATNDEVGQQTLFNTSVLEYNGKQRWNYPHSVVMQIDAFKRAVDALNAPA